MISIQKVLCFCAAGSIGYVATAQQSRDTIIPGQTIEIIQSYKPEIARPVKPLVHPVLPNIDTTRPHFQYEVPPQTLSYTYRSVPIRPLALGRSAFEMPWQNYVKAGFGNLSSVYVDAGVAGFRSEEYETNLHVQHLSQKGSIVNQSSSRTAVDADGKYYTDGHTLNAGINVTHNSLSYYGYDHHVYDFPKASVRQAFTGIDIKAGLENNTANQWDIDYKPQLSFGYYADKYNAQERTFAFDLPVNRVVDSTLRFSLGLKGNFTQLKNDSFEAANNYFQFNPAAQIRVENFSLHIGLSPTWGKDNTAYLLPDLRAQTQLFNNKLGIIAGWKGSLVQNTYGDLSRKNPFMYNIYEVKQTKADQIYAGFESTLGQHISYGGTLSWRQWRHLALFVNDYNLNPDGRLFATIYDPKTQAISLDAFIRYQVGNIFGLSASGSWYSFYHTEVYDRAFHEPMVKLAGNMYVRPLDQLYLSVGADFWDGIYAADPGGFSRKLPAFLDLSASAEYNIIPRLSIFLQLNNILGTQYERWNQYQAYGFNIIGGLRFKF
jgi:outer membrane receptor protein involved in Fe transport